MDEGVSAERRDVMVLGQKCVAYWTDFAGVTRRVVTSRDRLKFHCPSHAALRAHVFHRDGFSCVRCGAVAVNVPDKYDGRYGLSTNPRARPRESDTLVVDHILTRKAGGTNVVENLQTLCETCNKRKIKEDVIAATEFRNAVGL